MLVLGFASPLRIRLAAVVEKGAQKFDGPYGDTVQLGGVFILVVGHTCPDGLEHPCLVTAVFKMVDTELLQDADGLRVVGRE